MKVVIVTCVDYDSFYFDLQEVRCVDSFSLGYHLAWDCESEYVIVDEDTIGDLSLEDFLVEYQEVDGVELVMDTIEKLLNS